MRRGDSNKKSPRIYGELKKSILDVTIKKNNNSRFSESNPHLLLRRFQKKYSQLHT